MSEHKVTAAIESLRAFGQKNGHRITPPREHVLSIIAAADQPMTAYDVLDALGEKLDRPKPPTAYRALEFLMRSGFVHRIESLNAYVACSENHKHQGSQFMICDTCGHVEEAHLCHIPAALASQANEKGFRLFHWNAELHGQCGACENSQP